MDSVSRVRRGSAAIRLGFGDQDVGDLVEELKECKARIKTMNANIT